MEDIKYSKSQLEEVKLEIREKNNYDICYSMVNEAKGILDVLATNYSLRLQNINDELYRSITIKIFQILEENNAVTKNTQSILYENGVAVRGKLQNGLYDLLQISGSLSLILSEKIGHKLLKQIKEKGSSIEMPVNEYVYKTVSASRTLADLSLGNIESQIDEYNNKIIEGIMVNVKPGVIAKVKTCLEEYKLKYLESVKGENKIMFTNFANFLERNGTYFKNYMESVDALLPIKQSSNVVDELGVSKERPSLAKVVEGFNNLSNDENKKR